MLSNLNIASLAGALALIPLIGVSAQAHRLNVFAYPEGDEIKVESYFSRGGECMNCAAEAIDAAGVIVASGTTDEQGRWSFRPINREAVSIAVTAGEGHRGEYAILEGDYPDRLTREIASREEPSPQPLETSIQIQPAAVTTLSASDVEAIVEKVLERKLGPIRRELHKSQIEEPSLFEIIGGIGYIFGLFGVAAYFMSRSNRMGRPPP